ncbi:glycosyltransferase [Arthrobacter sp. K5]|uniref:Glycosyltransferase n=1 Tax=Arthrobacter sp. K5 TaxID=2839623 RepID=A0AAU8EWL9_9MICC
MKKVAIIGTRGYPSYYGGFETAVRKVAPYLADQGWDVTVYGRAGSVAPTDENRDVRIKSVLTRGLNTKSLSTLTFGLTSVLSALIHKPDVALVMNVANGFWLPLLKLRGVPTVVNVDGIEWERDKWSPTAKRVFRAGALMTARWANALVCDAVEIQRIWTESYGVRGRFIPYGGEAPQTKPIESGLAHRGYILLVARFVPENTVREFFRAAARLSQKWPVIIVGSTGFGGDLDQEAAELASSNPNVQWLGHLSDDDRLFSLWQHAGVYFHGHSVGGTNPALVQAMACGAPVVARDTPYNREVLGDYGKFVGPDDEQIADAIGSLMESPSEQLRLSEGSAERAQVSYSWEFVCGQYDDLLSRTVEGTYTPQAAESKN